MRVLIVFVKIMLVMRKIPEARSTLNRISAKFLTNEAVPIQVSYQLARSIVMSQALDLSDTFELL